jgi:hypothetical protein
MSKERLTADKQREWIINTILSIARNPEGYRISELKEKFNIVLIEYAEAFAAQEVEAAIAETKKQRDELLEALKELVHLHGCEQEGLLSGQPTPEQWYKAVEKAEVAITNAQEK